MTFDEILGQEAAVRLLQHSLESGRLPHALLFQGPEGVGKRTLALTLATAILCEKEGTDACERCAACRKVASGNHPDVLVYKREPPPERPKKIRSFIVVDQIRRLTNHAGFAPREGSRRIFIVDPADRMNREAQNALLKTLEEPPETTVLILLAERPHILLPTVRSRCLSVRLAPLPPSTLAGMLERRGFSPEDALARASLAQGCPGRALGEGLEAVRKRRDDILEAVENATDSTAALANLPDSASRISGADEDALREGLDLLEGLLRDAARAGSGALPKAMVYADVAGRTAAVGARLGTARAAALVRSVERLRGESHFHLNRTLVAESLLAAMAGGPIP